MRKLNLFQKYDVTRNDPQELQTSIITTRIYIILLCLTMCILTIYAATNFHTQTLTIMNPSQSTFENLHMKYSSNVECLCKEISIQYDSFVSLSPEYHPVCSSLFISSEWLLSLYSLNWDLQFYTFDDFRASGRVIFQVIKTLCSSVKTAIANSWFSFKQSSYITEYLLSKNEIIEQVQTIVNQFQSNTINDFQQGLNTIHLYTMNLFDTAMTNALTVSYKSLNTNESYIDFHYASVDWDDCSCALSDDCIVPIGFFEYLEPPYANPQNLLFNIPGLFVGCLAIRSVLQSSLECFYNQTCLDKIQTIIHSNRSIDIKILNQNQTRFSSQSSIGILLNELMLEKWGDKIHYDKYYQQCAPISCTYTVTERNNLSYIITFLIALFGGVSVTLKILVSFIVRWIRNRYRSNLNPTGK